MEFGIGYLLLYLLLFFSTTIANIFLPGFQYFVGAGVLVINLVLAFSVREVAWKSRKWKSFEDFQQCQEKWDTAAKTLLGSLVALAVVFMVFGFLAFNTSHN